MTKGWGRALRPFQEVSRADCRGWWEHIYLFYFLRRSLVKHIELSLAQKLNISIQINWLVNWEWIECHRGRWWILISKIENMLMILHRIYLYLFSFIFSLSKNSYLSFLRHICRNCCCCVRCACTISPCNLMPNPLSAQMVWTLAFSVYVQSLSATRKFLSVAKLNFRTNGMVHRWPGYIRWASGENCFTFFSVLFVLPLQYNIIVFIIIMAHVRVHASLYTMALSIT